MSGEIRHSLSLSPSKDRSGTTNYEYLKGPEHDFGPLFILIGRPTIDIKQPREFFDTLDLVASIKANLSRNV